MLKRTRKISLLAGLAGGALVLGGVGVATATATSTSASNSGSQHMAMQMGGGTNPDIGTSNCEASDFTVTMTPKKDEAVTTFVMDIKNQSNKTCTISNGFPGIDGVNMAGESVDLPVRNVEAPDAPSDFTLKPGDSAYAAVGVELGDSGDPNTSVISGFRTNLPNMPEQLDANLPMPPGEYLELPAKGLLISEMLSDPSDIR